MLNHSPEHLLFWWIVLRGVIWHPFLKNWVKVKTFLRLSHLYQNWFTLNLAGLNLSDWNHRNQWQITDLGIPKRSRKERKIIKNLYWHIVSAPVQVALRKTVKNGFSDICPWQVCTILTAIGLSVLSISISILVG